MLIVNQLKTFAIIGSIIWILLLVSVLLMRICVYIYICVYVYVYIYYIHSSNCRALGFHIQKGDIKATSRIVLHGLFLSFRPAHGSDISKVWRNHRAVNAVCQQLYDNICFLYISFTHHISIFISVFWMQQIRSKPVIICISITK